LHFIENELPSFSGYTVHASLENPVFFVVVFFSELTKYYFNHLNLIYLWRKCHFKHVSNKIAAFYLSKENVISSILCITNTQLNIIITHSYTLFFHCCLSFFGGTLLRQNCAINICRIIIIFICLFIYLGFNQLLRH